MSPVTVETNQPPYVLVCSLCGTQQELPAAPARDLSSAWLPCKKYGCGGTKFSLRLRNPIVKTEPHP